MGISYIYDFYFYTINLYILNFMEENNNPQEDDQNF